jgi:hypothetical protein
VPTVTHVVGKVSEGWCVACSTIAPVKVSAGEQCFRCRRIIDDTRLAGELIDNNGFVAKFRAPGCMAKYLAAHPNERGAVYVTDYASGRMVPPESALYVPVLVNRDTGERDYQAYRQRSDADAAAYQRGTRPVSWTSVMTASR